MAEFDEGQRYADFNDETDKTAAYGLAALVGGGIAAKAGLLAKLGLLLAKGWKLLFLAGVGLVAMVGKMRGKNKDGNGTAPASPKKARAVAVVVAAVVSKASPRSRASSSTTWRRYFGSLRRDFGFG